MPLSSGIELYYTDAVTVQRNETNGTVRKANGADYNGIDSDKSTTKSIIQYNYIHDNGDGILLCQFSFGNSIVRYNINGTQAGPAFASLTGYKLAAGSPAINAGTSIANNGGLDFWGTTLYVGNPDVGAFEAP